MPDKQAPFVLYAHPRSGNAYKAALVLALCDLPYEFRLVDLSGGEQRGEAYRAINRFAQVPALVHGKCRLVQSNVIVEYVAAHADRFQPANEADARRVREWLYWEQDMLFVGVGRTRFFTRVVVGDPALVAWMRGVGERALVLLETQLASGPWLVGNTPTAADIAVYAYARLAEEAGFDMRAQSATRAWRQAMEAMPGWAAPERLLPLP